MVTCCLVLSRGIAGVKKYFGLARKPHAYMDRYSSWLTRHIGELVDD